MLVVIALGGNVLYRRGAPMTADSQRATVRSAANALAPVAAAHQLVVGYGNGPQTGVLALQGAAYARVEACPLDVLGAQVEGTVGYLLEQELGNLLESGRPVATIQMMAEVDPTDPAFKNPTKYIGPQYLRDEADRLTRTKGWAFRPDGTKWRRVVASPQPRRIFEAAPIKWLLEHETVVIAAGGGGIPARCDHGSNRRLAGVECVIDKDLAFELLARQLDADLFVMLTDADAVYVDWGTSTQQAIRRAAPEALSQLSFAAESIGTKVYAACQFARITGKPAAIGTLTDLDLILAGEAGTIVSAADSGIAYADAPVRMASAVAS
jgi:carbamate kinase